MDVLFIYVQIGISLTHEKNGGKVLMGNNVACDVVGIGTVKVKMYDGIICTFSSARHVPKLKKNLIFWGTIKDNGLHYSSREAR